ncbi:hypothetical protein RI129_012554 [Pyrocoelia pectoralis]|uniref:CRAL-TRIO domain-containing protein n=1 Tax=Pyrocoelia pectoralis TaxID=417401 RepID=A0AAN7V0M0_9COLE
MSPFRLGFSVHDVIRDDKKIISDIDRIKEWLNGETLPKLLDEQILIFLTSAENDVQIAMKIIKGLYQMKQSRPDVFAARNINEDMRRNFRATLMCYLPVRHNESIIVLAKYRENSLSDFDFKCSIKTLTMFAEAAVYNGPEKGFILLVDGAGTTLRHIMKMKLNPLKMAVDYFQDYFPIRLTNVHFINA